MASENTKRIAKNTGMLYVRMLLNMCISIYTSRVVLNILGVEDFGVYNLVSGVISMFSFLNGAMSISTSRFIAFDLGKENIAELNKTFSTSLIIHIFLALAIILLGETVGIWFLETKLQIPEKSMTAARWIYQFSIISALFDITQTPYSACITAHEKMGIYAYFAILNNILRLLIVFLLYIAPFNKLIFYGAMGLAVSVLMRILYRVYCVKKFPECRFKWHWIPTLMKQMISFSGWNLYSNCAGLTRITIVPMLINMFFGVVANAAIGIANAVNGAVGVFSNNFINALCPPIVKSYAAGNSDYSVRLMISGSRLVAVLILFIEIPFLIETHFILKVWLKIVPEYSVWLSRISLAFLFVNMLSIIIRTGVHATGDVKRSAFISGTAAMLVLPISWADFKYLEASVYLPYILFVFSCSLGILIDIFIIKKHMKEMSIRTYFRQVILKSCIVGIIAIIPACAISSYLQEGWTRIFLVSCVSCTIVAILGYGYVFQQPERDVLRSMTRTIGQRLHLVKKQ